MAIPINRNGGLAALDAEYLDGMLALHQQVSALCQKYISDSDATNSPQVVDMARGTLESMHYADQMFREARGFADGDDLRVADHVEGVEVVDAY